nr:unnamed protein product [Callosobruchus chinensis]
MQTREEQIDSAVTRP